MVRWTKPTAANRRRTYIFLGLAILVVWILYLQIPAKPDQFAILEKIEDAISVAPKYLVYNSKCKMPSLEPYNKEILPFYSPRKYIKCSTKGLLTYITKENNVAVLHVDDRFVKQYSNNSIHCCYSSITRRSKSIMPDLFIDVSPCKIFLNSTPIPEDIVLVTCKNNKHMIVYENVHATVKVNKAVQKKMQQFDSLGTKEHLSVLFIGIDSVSRLNLIRSMPKTHQHLQRSGWLEFKGYNKIGDNTFPNLMGILTGMNETTAFEICNPRIFGELDKCNFIWHDYRKLGFITAFAEDEARVNTFNGYNKGFKKEPTDYYFRSYTLATDERLPFLRVDLVKYCTGPESAGERIFNLARDFSSTFKNYPNFGLFWINSFSHNEVNAISRMDAKVVDFLLDLNKTNILDNSIVIFISDHGVRYGPILHTLSGWLEEKLPLFYVSVPKWFKKKFATHYANLLKNTEKLTTPYDLYMTLQDIIVISGKNYSITRSSACPKCKSLFRETEAERSCDDAGIEHQFCSCIRYNSVSPKNLLVKKAAKFILNEIRKTIVSTGGDFEQCVDFKLEKIIFAATSDYTSSLNNKLFLITIQTKPEAVFQATVTINVEKQLPVFKLEGSVSRLDIYSDHSQCAKDSVLKKYCYCQEATTVKISIFKLMASGFKNFFKPKRSI